MITLKSRREIELMRQAGRLVGEAHHLAVQMIEPGVTTLAIDSAIEQLFAQHAATPLFKGVPGKKGPFPAVACISVNQQVVHGIPSERTLKEGDIVSIDTGCRLNGWCGDAAWTYAVGEVDPLKRRLLEVGEETLLCAIRELATASRWSQVARVMQKYVRDAGFSVVEEFVGHGIGREMHEDPQVPNYFGSKSHDSDFKIEPGLVLAIEPMVNAGSRKVRVLADGWTVETKDGKPSVHFEHTVAITEAGVEVLTEGVGVLGKV